jgi:thermitase
MKRQGITLLHYAALGLTGGLLAACSSFQVPTAQNTYQYALTVEVKPDETAAQLEQRYKGTIASWHPEAGFAVLGVDQAPVNDAAVKAVEPNQNAAHVPTIDLDRMPFVAPQTVTAGSWTAWSGGWTAWSGGWTAWSGGWTAWSGSTQGAVPPLPNENRASWNQIRLPAAQALSKNFGAGAKIAVIDTGIDSNHPAFSGRLAPTTEWKDFVSGDLDPQEVSGGNGYGHGSAVAGVILQVAPKATILPIRALASDGSGTETNLVSAIDWAIQKGAKIINLSLGSDTPSTALQTQINYATSLKIYVIASAGNDNTSSLSYPAEWAKTGTNSAYLISVGSTNATDGKSSFCDSGAALEIMAPGEQVYSASPGNQIGYRSGTSFAAPQVSGALALAMMETAAANRTNLHTYLMNGAVSASGYKRLDVVGLMRQLPDFQTRKALFVVSATNLSSGDDSAAKTRLDNLGYTVTMVTDLAAKAGDATGKDIVVISESTDSATVNTKFRDVTVPVVAWDDGVFDDMRMTGPVYDTDHGDTLPSYQTQINLTNPNHPMAAGLSGTVSAYSSGYDFTWGKPTSAAIKIASLSYDASKVVLFGYDKGAVMVGGVIAPARRVGLFVSDYGSARLTAQGGKLFDAAITWAVSGN